jgi:O-antigen ligase
MNTKILGWLKDNLRTRRDWGIALIALTPLAIIGRAVADYTASGAAVFFLVDCLLCRKWGWLKKPWIVAALGLWAYSVIRAMFIPHGGAEVFAAFAWLRYIVFAASVSEWAITEERGRMWLFYSATAAVLFLSIDGFIQYIFGYDLVGHPIFEGTRLTSVYARPMLGITIANFFALAIFGLLERRKIIGSILLADLCLATAFLSGDRMGLILAALIGLIWFFFLMRVSVKRVRDGSLAVGLFIALVATAPHVTFRPAPATPQQEVSSPLERQIVSTAATAKKIGSSAYGLVWKSALAVGEANPFFGVGIRQFRVACLDERFGPVTDPATGILRCYTHPHNSYLEWFSEGGFVGLLGFAAFAATVLIGTLRKLWAREAGPVLWGLSALLAVRLMPLFISTSFFNNWSAIPFWLALGWVLGSGFSSAKIREAAEKGL